MRKLLHVSLLLATLSTSALAQQKSIFFNESVLSNPSEVEINLPQGIVDGHEVALFDTTIGTRILASMNATYLKSRPITRHGILVSILIPGHPQWSGAIGTNDDVNPMDTGLAFEVASNTKTFVTALIMKLQDMGKLSIKDSIGKWLPNKYPNIDTTITIEQLLNHSSGIYDYLNDDPKLTVFRDFYNDPSRRWTSAEILDTFVGHANFKAGTSYQYSNTNFILAGLIAERAGGEKLGAQIHKYFIDPFKLTRTFFGGEDSVTIPYAHNWSVAGVSSEGTDFFVLDKTGVLSGAWGAGNIVSTTGDLMRWANLLYTGKVVSANSLKQMEAVHKWPNGAYYGLGTQLAPFYTRNFYGHGGSLLGFKSSMFTNPMDSVSVVAYMNSDANSSFADPTVNDYLIDILTEIYRTPSSVLAKNLTSGVTVAVSPNPVTDRLSFSYSLSKSSVVKLHIYNELGIEMRELVNESLPSGSHFVTCDVSTFAKGMYFYSLESPSGIVAGKISVK